MEYRSINEGEKLHGTIHVHHIILSLQFLSEWMCTPVSLNKMFILPNLFFITYCKNVLFAGFSVELPYYPKKPVQ